MAIVFGSKATTATFDASILAGQISESSMKQYHHHFDKYCQFAGSMADALKPSTLTAWRTHLAQTEHSPHYINNRLGAVKKIMYEAAAQGFIDQTTASEFSTVKGLSVKVMKLRQKAKARSRINKEDMIRMCNASDTSTIKGKRDHALLLTMATCGCHIDEVLNLKRSKIVQKRKNGKTGYIVFVMGKNQTEEHEAPIAANAVNAIDAWLDARGIQSDYIFTSFDSINHTPNDKPMTAVGGWRALKKYAEAIGLEDIKPHDFRRFVGTQLAKKNIYLAQKALGHKDASTTSRSYVIEDLDVCLTDDLLKL